MIAILAEGNSDAEALRNIVRRCGTASSVQVRARGYSGCKEMLRNVARDVRKFCREGAKRLIVCHDADGHPPETIEAAIARAVGTLPAEVKSIYVVPVQAIEAWIIADEHAVNAILTSFRFKGHDRPESLPRPKEWLIRESRDAAHRPRYSPAVHNPRIAEKLDAERVARKCQSFARLRTWLNS